MATKRVGINSFNSLENRQVLKEFNTGKPKGLRVREVIVNDECNNVEKDENVCVERKGHDSEKVNQRSSSSIIRGPTKPAFAVYCDDEIAQDGYSNTVYESASAKETQVEAPVDFSQWHEEKEGEKVAEATAYEVADTTLVFGGESQVKRRNEDFEDEVFLSTVEDESTAFHTAQCVPEQFEPRNDETLFCHSDYDKDIYLYMRDRELSLRPSSRYLSKQTDISSEMRYILIDWLADVTIEYDLSLECLHLAVSIVDRTLSMLYCPRVKLQLVGATAIMIATKFEEIFPPELKEFVYITDETYSAVQILRMEKVILNTLRFEISAPTSNWFASRLARMAECDKQTFFLMNYLLELALLDYRYLHFRSSVLACAAFCLANIITGHEPWPSSLQSITGMSLEELRVPVHKLLSSFGKAPDLAHKAVYEKYLDEKYRAVASLIPPTCLPFD